MFKRLFTAIYNWFGMIMFNLSTEKMCTLNGVPVLVDKQNKTFRCAEKFMPGIRMGKYCYSPVATELVTGEQIILLPHNWWTVFTEPQLQAILAHEIGHLINGCNPQKRSNSMWRIAWNEYQADNYAVQCGHGAALIEVLESIIEVLDQKFWKSETEWFQIELAKKRIDNIRREMAYLQ